MVNPLDQLLARVPARNKSAKRPSVTISFAQSLDGSIASRSHRPLPLSGPESMNMTHRLRAAHDAILVGIGTVVADNPLLTVRLEEGQHPQPVILDTHLRTPLEASVLQHPKPPLIACSAGSNVDRVHELDAAGARVLAIAAGPDGRVSLPALLQRLAQLGFGTLMVEGGSQVITSFVRERLADALVITVSPWLVGGLHAVEDLGQESLKRLPRLLDPGWGKFGSDFVVWGELEWQET